MIGASGAVAGVLGAYLVLYPAGQGARACSRCGSSSRWSRCRPGSCSASGSCCRPWRACCRSASPDVGVAFFAHVGGFVAGMGLGFVLAPRPRRAPGAEPEV